jgi:hypothetical protein
MKSVVNFVFFLLFFFSALANHTDSMIIDNNNQKGIEKIKRILESKEWTPTDSTIELQLSALISHLENAPIDSVITDLDSIIENKEILFVRDHQRIKNPEEVIGYIPQSEIARSLKKISTDISTQNPANDIIVPEEHFVGGYPSLGLITEDEVERMINDSIYTFPDSILAIILDPATDDNDSVRCYLDSVCSKMINEARIAYNQNLIQDYRDSITQQYRDNYIQALINSGQKTYLDSAFKVNNEILARYNDAESLRLNRELKEELQTLLFILKREPNQLTIVNLKNEQTTFTLQNDAVWHQWMWLKNSQNDSIGIRIENLDKHKVRMLVDESVNLSRLTLKDALEVGKITPSQSNSHTLSKFVPRNPVLSPWKLVGKAYSGFTQTYINEFWSQGGRSSASALSTFNYAANYLKDKIKWENFFDLKLGVIYYLPEEGIESLRNWHKNSDSFELNSRLGLSAAKKWYYSAEANFKTQLFYGFKSQNDTDPSSAFLSPGYLTFSVGMEYKPDKDFSTFISPISMKTTYVTHPLVDETRFGLANGETYKSRVGISGKIDYSKKVFENVNIKTKNSVFINFGNNRLGESQFLKLPDFDSETSIDFKVNHFITTQVNFHLIYDKDLESSWTSASGAEIKGTRLQVKEFFTLGISYKF